MRLEAPRRIVGPRRGLLVYALGVGCGDDPVAGKDPALEDFEVVDITTGFAHSCALARDGRTWCWGRNREGRTHAEEPVRAIEAGSHHTCGLTDDGRAVCWGRLDGLPPAEQRFVELCGGEAFGCGRTEAGVVHCWGPGDPEPPPAEPFTVPMQSLECGAGGICGLDRGGELVCWHNDHSSAVAPTLVPVVSFDLLHHACGLTEQREVVCWGADDDRPDLQAPPGQFTAVAIGLRYSCALTIGGEVRCWGEDAWSNLDSPPGRFTRISAGATHACALREDGRVLCWGQALDCIWNGEPMRDCSTIPTAFGEIYATSHSPAPPP
ncbi:RCC1 domain-containing protein [Nannocystis radixulma]|uniref:non-specific serine/threonine protein kinase n=1 Tax=Nannocystis radixulma TaxID=2995305 RepID=A0ABT5BG71_9BACT|nr:hypothetical protein [Nannocystis radixulma]MDC0672539.1 hypothetical protein [Nannocystis radixulma]